MALSTVTVTWDENDIGQAPLGGNITFLLSEPVFDSTDGIDVRPTPKTYFFASATGTGTSDPLVANDNVSLQPTGSYYTVTVAITGQAPYVFQSAINHANGATQTLSFLQANAAVPAAQFSAYLPLPSGTPAAGQVPVVVTNGSTATAWGSGGGGGGNVSSVFGRTGAVVAANGDYTAAQVGADASGLAAQAQANAIAAIPAIDPTATDILPLGTQAAGSTGKTADAGHVHPLVSGFLPSDMGLLEWNYDPVICTQGSLLTTAGVVYLIRVPVRVGRSITNVVLHCTAAGATLTASQNFAGIIAPGGTLIGATADQSSAWTSTGVKSMALSGGPYAVTSAFVWVALVFNGTTSPTFLRAANVSSSAANLGLGPSSARFASSGTGQTSLASITPSGNGLQQIAFWAGLS